MLYADKAALENRTKVRLLEIRERELVLYTNNCRAVGTVATLTAGVGFTALIYTKLDYYHDSTVVAQCFYILGCTVRVDPSAPSRHVARHDRRVRAYR